MVASYSELYEECEVEYINGPTLPSLNGIIIMMDRENHIKIWVKLYNQAIQKAEEWAAQ